VSSMSNDTPSRAAICTGPHGITAMRGAAPSMRTAWPTGDAAAVTRPSVRVMRQRRLAWPWRELQGRSVFADTGSTARKAAAHPLDVAINGGYVVRNEDAKGPDPWRPHPV
jgi:hypothetical protein